MENKKTAIERLISKCKNSLDKEPLDATEQEIGYSKALNHMILLLEEAKQIEQDQIEEAFNSSYWFIDGREYYEKTYGIHD